MLLSQSEKSESSESIDHFCNHLNKKEDYIIPKEEDLECQIYRAKYKDKIRIQKFIYEQRAQSKFKRPTLNDFDDLESQTRISPKAI